MTGRGVGVVVLVVGLAVMLVSAMADQIGIGSDPGIGWLQGVGIAVGAIATVVGAAFAMGRRAPGLK